MLNAIQIIFNGSFQVRLGTNPDHPTQTPFCSGIYAEYKEPNGGGPLTQSAGKGWTFGYGETAFDRIIRLSKPVALRNGLIDKWKDSAVDVINVERAGKKVDAVAKDPLVGQGIALGTNAMFWDPRTDPNDPIGNPSQEKLRGLEFSIGGSKVTALPVNEPTSSGLTVVQNWDPEYRNTKKSLLGSAGSGWPEARQYLVQTAPGIYSNFFTIIGAFNNIALKDVKVDAKHGILKEVSDPKHFDWTLLLAFCRYDGDTLSGRHIGMLLGVRPKAKVTLKLETDMTVLVKNFMGI